MTESVKKLSWLMVLVFAVGSSTRGTANADDKPAAAPARHAAADLLALMDMESLLKQGIEDGLNAQLQGTPMAAALGPKIKGFLAKQLSWPSLAPEFIALYEKSFTEDELKQLITFYKSPIGKKSAEMMPRLQMQGAQIAMSRVQAHMGELMQLLKEGSAAAR